MFGEHVIYEAFPSSFLQADWRERKYPECGTIGFCHSINIIIPRAAGLPEDMCTMCAGRYMGLDELEW
jgi:hypothetical protein